MILRMAEKKLPVGQITITLAALGIAFWVGRVSTPEAAVNQENALEFNRSNSRSTRHSASHRQPAGAGDQAITTTLQLHKISRHEGSTAAVIALAKMNSRELSVLARDLNTQNALTSNYTFSSEISNTFTRWAEIDPTAALQFANSSKQKYFQSRATHAIFTSLAKIDLGLARKKLANIADQDQRRSLKHTLFQALAKSDPQAWLQEIKSDPTRGERINIGSIAQEWALEDPAHAAILLQQSPENLQLQGIEPIAKIWAAKDPEAALTWVQSLTKASHRNKALSSVLAGIAVHDPDAALANLQTLPESSRGKGVTAIFKILIKIDFDTALSKANNLTSSAEQRLAFKEIISPNSANSFTAEQLNQLAQSAPNAGFRNQVLDKLGSKLSNFSKQDAEEILQAYPSKDQMNLKLLMVDHLIHQDPLRALKLYQSMPSEKFDSYTFSAIVRNIAITHPETALQLALKEKLPHNQFQAIESIFRQFARIDPNEALQRLDNIQQGTLRTKAIMGLAEAWSNTDPDAAMEWAVTLPESEKYKAARSILPQMAESSPEDAASHLKALLGSASEKSQKNISNSIYSIMDEWAKTDPTSAGAWASQLEEGPIKTKAIGQLAFDWYKKDSDGVADWIDQLPEGKTRDTSIRAVSGYIGRKDPDTAFAWAESIGNEKSRISQLSSIVRSWKSSDPEKARKKVENADLTSDERTRLMKYLE